VLPTFTDPKLCVRGVQVKLGDVPVTVSPSAVVETVPPKVQLLLKVAVREPLAVGVELTITVQLLLVARLLVPQLSVWIAKSPELLPPKVGAEHPVAVAVPEFANVKV
jgi:hypothetical protein